MNTATEPVTIVDRGRGPQLSNRRLTVQDMLPFFRKEYSDEEILKWHPQIGQCELDLLRQYYVDHREEVLELERQIAAYHEELRKLYPPTPSRFDGMSREEKIAAMREIAERKRSERNGKPHTS